MSAASGPSRRGFAQILLTVALGAATLLGSPALAAARPQIWFAADDPWVRAWKRRVDNDYMKLFTGDGAWARNVDVVELSMQFVMMGQEDQLRAVIAFAQNHKIKLAMVGLMLAKGKNNCGDRLEGYSNANGVEKAAMRFKKLGGTLSYITMDEPVYYGSVYPFGNACQTPIDDLAAETASHLKRLREIFPALEVGEDDVVGLADRFQWVATLARWFDAYRKAAGEPVAFYHADVGWQSPRWQKQLPAIEAAAHKAGVKFGVIFTGLPKDPDDGTWAAHAREHAWTIERRMGMRLDHAVIQSWMPHPNAMLPPSDPSTLTGVLRCYLQIDDASARLSPECRPGEP